MDKKEELEGSHLGRGVFFRGKIKFQGEFTNDGDIEGSITGDKLLQGSDGKISGNIQTKEFVNNGFFRGDMISDIVRLKEGSDTEGSVETKSMNTEDGGHFVVQLKDLKSSSR